MSFFFVMSSLHTLYWLHIVFETSPDSKALKKKTHKHDQTALCTGFARDTHGCSGLGRVPIIIGIGGGSSLDEGRMLDMTPYSKARKEKTHKLDQTALRTGFARDTHR